MIVFRFYSKWDYSNMITPLTMQAISDNINNKISESALL